MKATKIINIVQRISNCIDNTENNLFSVKCLVTGTYTISYNSNEQMNICNTKFSIVKLITRQELKNLIETGKITNMMQACIIYELLE